MKPLLTARQRADYLARCYQAVDGLWFMKTEAALGFKRTLAIDLAVWRVMPKIQARKLRGLLRVGTGLAGLARCFAAKLQADGFAFTLRRTRREVVATVTRCPWHELLVRSGRQHLSPVIGGRICGTEYRAWAKEFGPGVRFVPGPRLCRRGDTCILRFVAN